MIEMTMHYKRSKFKILAVGSTIAAVFSADNSAWANPRSEALCKQALEETKSLTTNDLAIKHIDQALSIEPQNAYYWSVKAQLLQNLEESEKALPCMNKSLQLGYKPASSYILKADILYDLGRLEEALRAADQALELCPRADFINIKAKIFQKQGKLDLAEKELDKVVKANPSDLLARSHRSTIAVLAKHWPKAIEDLTFIMSKSTKKNLSYYQDLLARAGAYTATKQYEKAIADCKEGIKGEPDMRQFHVALLKIYTLNGNKAGAESERKELTAIEEDYRPAKDFGP